MAEQNVRRAEAADVPELARLMVEFYAEADLGLERAAAERAFVALLGAPGAGQVFVLEADGQAAGFVVLTVSFSMEYGALRGFVDDFFVARSYRRRGLGGAALDAVKAECRRRGIRALLVETGADNALAGGVYRRAGFVDSGRQLLTLPLAPPLHGA